MLFPPKISLRVNTCNFEDFHATLQPNQHEEIVHFQIVMQHLFTAASDQSNWSRAIQSCQRKRTTSFEWQGLVISRNSSSMIRDRPWCRWKIVLGSRVIQWKIFASILTHLFSKTSKIEREWKTLARYLRR